MQPLLPPRLAAGLALITIVHVLLLGWSLAPAGSVPFAGLVQMRTLPYLMCAWAAALIVLSAPLLLPENEDAETPVNLHLGRALFAALWQGAVSGFFLMIAARLTPLNPAGILLASAWLSAVAFTCLLITAVSCRAYAGLSFFWLFALPVCGYLLAELFLMSPAGNSGWQQSSGPQAQAIRGFLHALLSFSPATGAAAALTGSHLDGSVYSGTGSWIALGVINAILLWRLKRGSRTMNFKLSMEAS